MTRTARLVTGIGIGAALTAAGLYMLSSNRTAEADTVVGDARGDVALTASNPNARGNGETITVYRSPTCGCCKAWEEHMRAAGYIVESVETQMLDPIKDEHGVPRPLRSCHMGVVEGYVIEGHVPAEDVVRLLAERPDIKGLAVPGMPPGSPGMDVAGHEDTPFEVFAFRESGDAEVWATRR